MKTRLERIDERLNQLIQEMNEIKSQVDYELPEINQEKNKELEEQRRMVYEKFMNFGKLMFELWPSMTKDVF